ncbi:MAG: hypothetical protein IKZ49_03575 [Alphaproteobacteria bacterium]|nr:hypothetical protein [Alphaproteobacteria bacterium]
MDNEKIETKYFLNNFPQPTKDLFYSDPKKFKTLYKTKLVKIVKQDLLQIIPFITPVYEIVHYSDWYDSWHEDFYWYKVQSDKQEFVRNLLKIYCVSEANNMANKTKFESKSKAFFNLLRTIYFYVNYKNKEKWKMSGIMTWNKSGHDVYPEIYVGDFVETDYKSKRKKKPCKIGKTKSELEKQIDNGCEKIADRLIDAEIKRISNINKQIQMAKATLARYGSEQVIGY